MRDQRPPHLPAAIDAMAENLPFSDKSFDAAMSTFSVHQWKDLDGGLREMRRVTRGPVVILTCDPDELDRFWLRAYCPDVIEVEASRYPPIARLVAAFRGRSSIVPVPIPLDCSDGFTKPLMADPKSCSILQLGSPVRHGASSTTRPCDVSSTLSEASSRPADGTRDTATPGDSRPSPAR